MTAHMARTTRMDTTVQVTAGVQIPFVVVSTAALLGRPQQRGPGNKNNSPQWSRHPGPRAQACGSDEEQPWLRAMHSRAGYRRPKGSGASSAGARPGERVSEQCPQSCNVETHLLTSHNTQRLAVDSLRPPDALLQQPGDHDLVLGCTVIPVSASLGPQ